MAPAYQDNPETGLDYNDHATWIAATVDVVCITNSTTTQAKLITPPCGCGTTCTETETDACIHLRLPEIGSVDIRRTSSGAALCCSTAQWVELNYQAGLTELTRAAEDAIIRLAHT